MCLFSSVGREVPSASLRLGPAMEALAGPAAADLLPRHLGAAVHLLELVDDLNRDAAR